MITRVELSKAVVMQLSYVPPQVREALGFWAHLVRIHGLVVEEVNKHNYDR